VENYDSLLGRNLRARARVNCVVVHSMDRNAKTSITINPTLNNDAIVPAIVFALGLSFHDRRPRRCWLVTFISSPSGPISTKCGYRMNALFVALGGPQGAARALHRHPSGPAPLCAATQERLLATSNAGCHRRRVVARENG
jgi:hypothetical protein